MNCVSHFRGSWLPFTVVQCHLQASYYGNRSGYVWLLYYCCSVMLTTFILPWLHLRFSLFYNNSICGESFSVFSMTDMLRESPHILFFILCLSYLLKVLKTTFQRNWGQQDNASSSSLYWTSHNLSLYFATFSTFFWLQIVKRTDSTSDFVNNHCDQKISQYRHCHIIKTKYNEINTNNVKFILSLACDVCYLLHLFHFHY